MQVTPSFRLAYVPGVTPGKWARVWSERLPDVPLALVAVEAADGEPTLRAGDADAGLLRLPVDRTGLSAIPLYTETTVVVFPKDHWLAAAEEVTVADLADDVVFHPLDDTLEWEQLPGRPAIERPATTADAVELVAAGVGVLLVPQSLARLHHRRDLTYRTMADAPQSRIALSWPEEQTTDLVEEFIGIVRGRTVNSSRGRGQAATASAEAPAAKSAPGRAGGAKGGTGKGGAVKGGAAKGVAPKGSGKPAAGGRATAGGRARGGSGSSSGGAAAARRGRPKRRG
ncbi:LysR substrate binding domain-containing protein [Streptomyces sp. TLI_053]|uniref:LysR family substrate-binding domain-containing protein n=1 Tax=Streptomyces sp. TLI_053 TaxID=1855352 RepID=UPI00087C3121|nr:LysR family substrate-binding domain-containing protein [Streptomyces sp. TLI_053]SDT81029.1 LysR substrate binding domain-containing protein [Streptomyces sp. TLI_053]